MLKVEEHMENIRFTYARIITDRQ